MIFPKDVNRKPILTVSYPTKFNELKTSDLQAYLFWAFVYEV